MKKLILIILIILPVIMNAQVVKILKKNIELRMPKKATDNVPGTRGASVVWHPIQKKYYAAFAGNEEYPLAVFNVSGKLLSDSGLICMFDTRGLWYNSKRNKIFGNGYSDIGWFNYTLDSKGIPNGNEVIFAGMNQPNEQSVGVYNGKSRFVYFMDGTMIHAYDSTALESKENNFSIYPGINKPENILEGEDEELSEDYNSSMIYTGIVNAEIGLLNIVSKQIELYNIKTGLMTQRLILPSDIELHSMFDFSFCNGIYWIFDEKNRKWIGCN